MAFQISLDVTRFHVQRMNLPLPEGLECPFGVPSAETLKMRSLQAEFRRMYKSSYPADFAPVSRTDAYHYFMAVLDEMFADGFISWGRIVAVYYFGTEFAPQCIETGQPDLVTSIVEWVASYVEKNLMGWVNANGGWSAMTEVFRNHPGCDNSILKDTEIISESIL